MVTVVPVLVLEVTLVAVVWVAVVVLDTELVVVTVVAEVLDAVREHGRVSGKKVTFEYVILPGVNDRDEDIVNLARRVRGIPSRVNLIGFNPFEGAPYEKPRLASILSFRDRLAARFDGVITLRRSRGEDIQGACGQLSLARGHSGH